MRRPASARTPITQAGPTQAALRFCTAARTASWSIALIVIGTIPIARAITLEATLSVLGLGVPITEPSLGLLIANGYQPAARVLATLDAWQAKLPQA